jgi:hypothetical protein
MSLTLTTEATGAVAEACKGDYFITEVGTYTKDGEVGEKITIRTDLAFGWVVEVPSYGSIWYSSAFAGVYLIQTTGLAGPAMNAEALVIDNDPNEGGQSAEAICDIEGSA